MEAVETIEYEFGIKAKLFPMEYVEDPREKWEHVGTMICAHSRYKLGDIQVSDGDEAILRMLESDTAKCVECGMDIEYSYGDWVHYDDDNVDVVVNHEGRPDLSEFFILPLFLYEHSGITMKTSPFSCPWDSGQVGIIFVSKVDAAKHWDANTKEKALECLRLEVEEYDQYLTGDVYGYVIEDEEGDILDSCWGFYGWDYAIGEMKDVAEYYENAERKIRDEISKRMREL